MTQRQDLSVRSRRKRRLVEPVEIVVVVKVTVVGHVVNDARDDEPAAKVHCLASRLDQPFAQEPVD